MALSGTSPAIPTSAIMPLKVFAMFLLARNPETAFNAPSFVGKPNCAYVHPAGYHSPMDPVQKPAKDAFELRSRLSPMSPISMSDNSESNMALVALEKSLGLVQVAKGNRWLQYGNSWVMVPRGELPWGVVHFVGGAGFGVAPQLCYNTLLSSLVDRAGVMVIATPYGLDTDHWKLSQMVHQEFAQAWDATKEMTSTDEDSTPVFRIGHSLGAKLLVLKSVRDAEEMVVEEGSPKKGDALALLAFNNFGIKDSAALAADFIGRIQGGDRGSEVARNVFDAFNVVQQIASSTGLGGNFDVSPTPEELENRAAQKYNAASTALYRFDPDTLDCSKQLLDNLPMNAKVTFNELEGSHLSPVVFNLEASDIDPTLAMLMGSNQGFSFGNKDAVQPLVSSLCSWVQLAAQEKYIQTAQSGE